jgi:phage major head subunit gpT-like protein
MPFDTGTATAAMRGMTKLMTDAFQSAQPVYPSYCATMPSGGRDEDYAFLGAVPRMKEWIGERTFEKVAGAEFKVANAEYASGLEIEKNDFDDDRLNLYGDKFSELGAAAGLHPDELLIKLVKDGHTLACFDGQTLYDTDHVWGKSGAQTNNITITVADPDNPTEVEIKKAVNKAVETLMGYVNDKGEPLSPPMFARLNKLSLWTPLAYRQPFATAMTATVIGNTTNVVLDNPTIMASPHLTGRTFFLHNLDGIGKPFIFQTRRKLRNAIDGVNDPMKKSVKYMVDARYAMAPGLWWKTIRITLAGA